VARTAGPKQNGPNAAAISSAFLSSCRSRDRIGAQSSLVQLRKRARSFGVPCAEGRGRETMVAGVQSPPHCRRDC
jgi:hypothetical protein